MRLINTTSITLEEVAEKDTGFPAYAILSHTWGDEEVTFQEMQSGNPSTWKEGYRKIVGTCKLASESGIKYAWVDTCCIDKSSSAELSEAINSMFTWYERAEICYAYLSDVPSNTDKLDQLTKSRWFTRGWTLQELIAPKMVLFYSSNWDLIGSRDSLRNIVSSRTGIATDFLTDGLRMPVSYRLRRVSIAERMSWASRRKTTRAEDLAYCLLGLFDINMPLLYGEGQGAFIRLQEEIMRHSDDHTIFAWGLFGTISSGPNTEPQGLLASKPELFTSSDGVVAVETGENLPFSRTNRGIQIQLRVFENGTTIYAVLHCRKGHAASLLAIPLTPFPGDIFRRNLAARPRWITYAEWRGLPVLPMFLSTTAAPEKYQIPPESFLVKPLPKNVTVAGNMGEFHFDPSTGLIQSSTGRARLLVVKFRRLVQSSWEETEREELMSMLISVHPRVPTAQERRYRFDYLLWYEEKSPDGSSTYYGKQRNRSWLATLEHKTVFGQRVFVIEVHQAETRADAAYLMLLRTRRRISRLAFWWHKNIIDPLEDATPFLNWRLIFEFCLLRPAMLLWLWFCIPPPEWVEGRISRSNLSLEQDFGILATDEFFYLVIASALAMASCLREMKIAPDNGRLAVLVFCGFLAMAVFRRNGGSMLFLGVAVTCWMFPVAERYHHHSGRRRRLGFYVGEDAPGQEDPPPPARRTPPFVPGLFGPGPAFYEPLPALSLPRPGTAFG